MDQISKIKLYWVQLLDKSWEAHALPADKKAKHRLPGQQTNTQFKQWRSCLVSNIYLLVVHFKRNIEAFKTTPLVLFSYRWLHKYSIFSSRVFTCTLHCGLCDWRILAGLTSTSCSLYRTVWRRGLHALNCHCHMGNDGVRPGCQLCSWEFYVKCGSRGAGNVRQTSHISSRY